MDWSLNVVLGDGSVELYATVEKKVWRDVQEANIGD